MNSIDDFSQRQCDNTPVFFTGLTKNTNKPKVPLLCILCGSSIANNKKNKDLSSKDTQNHNGCENCTKHFNNLKEALALLSKIPSFPSSPSPAASSSQSSTNHINIHQSKQQSLLLPPIHPSSSKVNPHIDKSPNYKQIKEDRVSTPNRMTDIKRKNHFHENNSKKSRTGHSPSVRHIYNSASPENYCDELSKSIWQLFAENKQTPNVYKNKMALRDKLHEILLTTIPNCGLYVVGSSMTGLGGNSSDMDMCLMLTDDEIDQEKEATKILHTVHSVFLDCSFLTDVQVIYAKVPILRFTDRVSGIEVDLNVNNAVGIRNTQLLSSYARVDERFPPLVLLVKMWARFNGINDAKNNTLSSYSLVLMVIHYLQYACEPPVLPCLQKLQPEKYQRTSDVRNLKLREDLPDFVSENKKDLGDLFVGFLNYFSNEFDYFRSVMSIRLGTVLPKEVARNNNSPKNKKGHWKYVCIEEPFDLTNTACAVFKPGVFHYIKQVFSDSWRKSSRSADLSSIMGNESWS